MFLNIGNYFNIDVNLTFYYAFDNFLTNVFNEAFPAFILFFFSIDNIKYVR